MTKKAHVGLIVDSVQSSKMLYSFIKLSQSSTNYEITHLIIQKTNHFTKNLLTKSLQYVAERGFNKFLAAALFKILCKFESLVIKRQSKFKSFFDTHDLSKFSLKVLEVEPIISKSGLVYRYSESDLSKIKSLNLNLLVRGGSGILRGDILSVCENGIISFHHADNDVNRGGPPGFWEVANKEKRTGFVIQRLTNELDGGDVLFKGFIATSFMYTLNLAKLYEKSNPFLHIIIEKLISDPTNLQVLQKRPYSFPLYKTPSIATQLSYIWSTLTIVISKVVRRLKGESLRWGVAYQFVDNWKDVALWRSKRIPNPPNRFLADPFVIKRDQKHYCFVEDYDYTSKCAHISVYEITKDTCREVGVALKEDFHLSYPFLLEHKNEIYMCPETHQAKDIRLYKCVEFPLKWELANILMSDVSAADTTIFYKDKKWWLLTNICSSSLPDHGSELHIFSSNDLFSKEWKAHPKNPIFFDPLVARNGGFLTHTDGQYRVFQKQGFDFYGESLGVSKIDKLDESEYVESFEFEVLPAFFPSIKGTHTYSFCDGLLTLDFVKVDKHKKRN